MIVILSATDAQSRLASGAMACPECGGVLAKWGHGRFRIVRGSATSTVTVQPAGTVPPAAAKLAYWTPLMT